MNFIRNRGRGGGGGLGWGYGSSEECTRLSEQATCLGLVSEHTNCDPGAQRAGEWQVAAWNTPGRGTSCQHKSVMGALYASTCWDLQGGETASLFELMGGGGGRMCFERRRLFIRLGISLDLLEWDLKRECHPHVSYTGSRLLGHLRVAPVASGGGPPLESAQRLVIRRCEGCSPLQWSIFLQQNCPDSRCAASTK